MILIEILLILMNYKCFLFQVEAHYSRFLGQEQVQVLHEQQFLYQLTTHLVIVLRLIVLVILIILITIIILITLIALVGLILIHHFIIILQVKLIILIGMSFIRQSLKLYLILYFLLCYLLIDCKPHRIENLL